MRSATVVARWPLPTPTAGETWQSIKMLPGGLLLAHRTPTKLLSLELYDPTTGTLGLVLDLSALPGK